MSETREYLERLLRRYRTEYLINVDADEFEETVKGFVDVKDAEIEGFQDPDAQRPMSVNFVWGHDLDFGAFEMTGSMEDNHLNVISRFVDTFGFPLSLDGCRALDIGCWTGGISLLLAAMGAKVVAVEEVRKYIVALRYLVDAFGISDSVDARPLSLYECTGPEFEGVFDYVVMSGVLYHVTDPVLALRIAFNCLKVGGQLLLETMFSPTEGESLSYYGCRSGWNWLVPTQGAVIAMLKDVGYTEISEPLDVPSMRLHVLATKTEERDMARAGLSRRVR